MKVGYARVSRQDQNLDLQRRELEAADCEKIFEERVSSRKERRPVLQEALDYLRTGDVLVVWRLDRLGRSLKELIELVGDLQERGVEFKSLRESLDTTTPGGKLVFHVFASIAEFERDIIRERTMAGLEAARARGRKGGRKPVMDERKIALASNLMKARVMPVSEVCETVGVSRATLYRYVKPDGTPRERQVTNDPQALRESGGGGRTVQPPPMTRDRMTLEGDDRRIRSRRCW
jgi:DNA invertase Pin-like site-specific DNA recombinase